jgi:hypothetical protein
MVHSDTAMPAVAATKSARLSFFAAGYSLAALRQPD